MEPNGGEPAEWDEQAAARQVFGERFDIAERYYKSLATDGVERGVDRTA